MNRKIAIARVTLGCLLVGMLLVVLAVGRVAQVQEMRQAQLELQTLRGERQQMLLRLSRLRLEHQALLAPVVLQRNTGDRLRLAGDAGSRVRSLPLVVSAEFFEEPGY